MLFRSTHARSVVLPLFDGERGVAPGQTPFIGRLGAGEVRVVGEQGAAGDAVRRTAVDFNNFSFAAVRSPNDPMVLPSGARFGDLIGLSMLCAPGELFARGMDGYRFQSVQDLQRAYELAGNPAGLQTPLPGRDGLDDAIAWLLRDAPTQ